MVVSINVWGRCAGICNSCFFAARHFFLTLMNFFKLQILHHLEETHLSITVFLQEPPDEAIEVHFSEETQNSFLNLLLQIRRRNYLTSLKRVHQVMKKKITLNSSQKMQLESWKKVLLPQRFKFLQNQQREQLQLRLHPLFLALTPFVVVVKDLLQMLSWNHKAKKHWNQYNVAFQGYFPALALVKERRRWALPYLLLGHNTSRPPLLPIQF